MLRRKIARNARNTDMTMLIMLFDRNHGGQWLLVFRIVTSSIFLLRLCIQFKDKRKENFIFPLHMSRVFWIQGGTFLFGEPSIGQGFC